MKNIHAKQATPLHHIMLRVTTLYVKSPLFPEDLAQEVIPGILRRRKIIIHATICSMTLFQCSAAVLPKPLRLTIFQPVLLTIFKEQPRLFVIW